jgi:hypothetical protein
LLFSITRFFPKEKVIDKLEEYIVTHSSPTPKTNKSKEKVLFKSIKGNPKDSRF